MKKRQQFETARAIAALRQLQLERARMDTLRVAQAYDSSVAHEQSLQSNLDAHLDGWRDAMQASGGLSPSLAANWSGAAGSIRAACVDARQCTQNAADQLEQQRAAMARHEQQAEHARNAVGRAKRQFERHCDEQRASRIEDMYLSQENRA
ncbi:hypothetical protein BTH42_14945 [Burkholderia sp. SRS-W-2-2016]|uniref:hypothetical protein n=1 Tax=Burkholderia sp. SRS-W-2-2016 TaxID=1926878 RepID=UPI00094B2A6A|nr:hypothetical protein [Burkholderia sp. SRS-W-2-2016]OLL30869.1 hypothetical protein BTH42_14945 [Burkholderia sp. SRS-W-2-2016]